MPSTYATSVQAYWKNSTCLRCRSKLGEKKHDFRYAFPCGHVMCKTCYCPHWSEISFCERCDSCIWRASRGDSSGCTHQVPVATISPGETRASISGTKFFLPLGRKLGSTCGRCTTVEFLQKLTVEVRETAAAARRPEGRWAYASLGQGPDALHGLAWPGLEPWTCDMDRMLPELDEIVAEQRPRLVAMLAGVGREPSWQPEMLDERLVFRESFMERVCRRDFGMPEPGPDSARDWVPPSD